MESEKPFVSVIIPVFNDSERLKVCLKALEEQTYPEHLYEVIVVDNGSDKMETVREVVSLFSKATLDFEDFPGSYAARNKGVSVAKGSVIAFTDADCIPHQNWIEEGIRHLLSTPNCGLVAGKIKLFFKDDGKLTPVELYEKFYAFEQQKYIEESHYGATANVFTFKETLEKVGLFDRTLKSTGDFEWGNRVFSFGYRQVYADSVCVDHPARSSFHELKMKNKRLAGGIYDLFCQKKLSKLDFNKLLVRTLLLELIDPFAFSFKVSANPKIQGVGNKMTICTIRFVAIYTRFLEKIKLRMGGISVRE